MRTKAEYYQDTKEAHREKRQEYAAKYYEENKEMLNEKSREHWKTYGPTYREENREKITKRRQIRYTCECGIDSLFDHKSRHERSRAHLEWATIQVAAN